MNEYLNTNDDTDDYPVDSDDEHENDVFTSLLSPIPSTTIADHEGTGLVVPPTCDSQAKNEKEDVA